MRQPTMSQPSQQSRAVESTNQTIASVAQKVHDAAASQVRSQQPEAGQTAHSTLIVTGTGDIVSQTVKSTRGEGQARISNKSGT